MNISTLHRINNLFDSNKWKKFSPEYDSFCNLINFLGEDYVDIVIEMTGRYLWINIAEYLPQIMKLFNSFNSDLLTGIKEIYISPLISEQDINKGLFKSGMPLTKHIKDQKSHRAKKYDHINLHFKEVPGQNYPSSKDINSNNSTLIFLIDDFIGTGKTAYSCVRYLSESLGYNKNRVYVLALFAQNRGARYMKFRKINYILQGTRKRGLTDYYYGDKLKEKSKLIDEIGKKIKINRKRRFGYLRSESLITITRGHNNTFPMYWFNPKGQDFYAMFPRKKK